MKQSVKQNLSFGVLLLFIYGLSGCATGAHRFYSGQPLPKNEIALVYAVSSCEIIDIRNEREKQTKGIDMMSTARRMLDLLPVQYIVGIIYSYDLGQRTYTYGDRAQIKLNAQPGNVYIIYPEFYGEKWKPIIINIDDYKSEKEIIKKTKAYLQSERPIMSFRPYSETPYTPVTEEARERKGVWR